MLDVVNDRGVDSGLEEYLKDKVRDGFTILGALIFAYYLIKILYRTIQGFRLYVLSQYCCSKTDYVKRYGRWAVISGATDGIGLAMARELAQRGHSIVVIGRNEAKLAATQESLEKEENVGEVITVKIDLSDSSIENFEFIKDKLEVDSRDIGILINNAGMFPADLKRFHNFPMSELRGIVNLNILATVYLTRMVLPGMIDRGRGLILNVSSLFSTHPAPFLSVYGPTKTFMDAFSRLLEIEYYKHPIDIINLNPGAVHTKLFKDANSSFTRATPFNPSPEDYAKSALNAVSCRITPYCGILSHGLINLSSLLPVPIWVRGLTAETSMRTMGMNTNISPVPKRRKPSTG